MEEKITLSMYFKRLKEWYRIDVPKECNARNVNQALIKKKDLVRKEDGKLKVTAQGRQHGISEELRIGSNGEEYTAIVYGIEGQKYILSLLSDPNSDLDLKLDLDKQYKEITFRYSRKNYKQTIKEFSPSANIIFLESKDSYYTYSTCARIAAELLGKKPYYSKKMFHGLCLSKEHFSEIKEKICLNGKNLVIVHPYSISSYQFTTDSPLTPSFAPAAMSPVKTSKTSVAAEIEPADAPVPVVPAHPAGPFITKGVLFTLYSENENEFINLIIEEHKTITQAITLVTGITKTIAVPIIPENENYRTISPGSELAKAALGKVLNEKFECADDTYKVVCIS